MKDVIIRACRVKNQYFVNLFVKSFIDLNAFGHLRFLIAINYQIMFTLSHNILLQHVILYFTFVYPRQLTPANCLSSALSCYPNKRHLLDLFDLRRVESEY